MYRNALLKYIFLPMPRLFTAVHLHQDEREVTAPRSLIFSVGSVEIPWLSLKSEVSRRLYCREA